MSNTVSPARRLASIGLFAALTFLASSVLKIPTPTFGYIHLGDGFVLLAGFLLGPVCGGLAAGIGSALSDLVGGYVVWVPGTFLIKFLTAFIAACVLQALQRLSNKCRSVIGGNIIEEAKPALSATVLRGILPSGIAGEIVMVAGYFLYNIVIILFAGGSADTGFATAAALSLAEIPFNLIQGAAGLVLASVLYPVCVRNFTRYHLPVS